MSLVHYPSSSLIAERRFPLFNERAYYAEDVHTGVAASTDWQCNAKTSNDLGVEDHRGSFGSWHTHSLPSWSVEATGSSSSHVIDDAVIQRTAGFLAPSESYPESSQRTALRPSSSSSTPFLSPSSFDGNSLRSPTHTLRVDEQTWGKRLYTMDDQDPQHDSPSTSPSPPVKLESDDSDNCFIMEFSSQSSPVFFSQEVAPHNEVPLRATQASKEMRKMMGVFRLNPFTMHSSGCQAVGSSWYEDSAGPLEEEPQMFEFQIELEDLLVEDDVRDFSPDYATEENGEECSTWGGSTNSHVHVMSSQEDSHVEGYLSSAESTTTLDDSPRYTEPAMARLSRKSISHEQPLGVLRGAISSATLDIDALGHRHSPSEPAWSPGGYSADSRSSSFQHTHDTQVDDPIASSCTQLRAGVHSYANAGELSAMARRWSLPQANPNAPFLL